MKLEIHTDNSFSLCRQHSSHIQPVTRISWWVLSTQVASFSYISNGRLFRPGEGWGSCMTAPPDYKTYSFTTHNARGGAPTTVLQTSSLRFHRDFDHYRPGSYCSLKSSHFPTVSIGNYRLQVKYWWKRFLISLLRQAVPWTRQLGSRRPFTAEALFQPQASGRGIFGVSVGQTFPLVFRFYPLAMLPMLHARTAFR
jgi:hypothetical protein